MSVGEKIPKAEDEDGEWEDVPQSIPTFNRSDSKDPIASLRNTTPSRSCTPNTPRSAIRRRKAGKTGFLAQPSASPRRPPQKPRKRAFDSEQVHHALLYGAASSVRYFGAVFTHALQLLRKPLGFLVFFWLFAFLLAKISDHYRSTFSPFCWVPGFSYSRFCQTLHAADNGSPPPPKWADYPSLIEVQSTSFEKLLDGAVGGSGLSLEIKKAEMATKDLVTLVNISELKSRDLLAQSLHDFVEHAKLTGKSLQKLTSKINGAVDTIMSLNDHALHTIAAVQNPARSPILRIIWPLNNAMSATPHAVLIERFRDSLEAHETTMRRLILEVEVASANLDQLDAYLIALHELCARENLTLSSERDEVLSELWTVLGGNRARLRKFSTNFELLRDLGEYRKRAAAHVAAAAQTLQAMAEDIEDLRERVAAPDIMGDRIPIEVHMKSIRAGMERLQDQRIAGREREAHLLNKILGIEA